MIEQARKYAIDAHKGQMYGDNPYVYHLDKVVFHLKGFCDSASVIGYLHDVVEDTDRSVQDIELQFGALVATAVSIVSDESGKNRKERKKKTYAKMALVVNPDEQIALIVKTADRLANLQECVATSNSRLLRIYMEEHPTFSHSVYRQGLCDNLWTMLNSLVQQVHDEKLLLKCVDCV